MEPIIEIKGIGKRYQISHQRGGYIALRDVLADMMKRPLRFLRRKTPRALGGVGTEDFWALRDINLSVERGEVIGIIGGNGAGKSTLLKILTGITPPTEGEIIMRGRVASLLEVGTGFHPELTGRENIYLNGAILGMPRKEIVEKFDAIVEFAGIEKFLDTPVKHYSSGMYVRLAFSVAAHLEPDILLVDEVLAVGDAEFQKKCLGKMEEVTKKDGRTILFVSHNLAAIRSLCSRTILLEHGRIKDSGGTERVISTYLSSPRAGNLGKASLKDRHKRTNGAVIFHEARGVRGDTECWDFTYDEEIVLRFSCEAVRDVDNLLFYLAFLDPLTNAVLTNFKTVLEQGPVAAGKKISFDIRIPPRTLRPGQFLLYLALGNAERSTWYDVLDANVSLPPLHILPADADAHEQTGIVSIPYRLIPHE